MVDGEKTQETTQVVVDGTPVSPEEFAQIKEQVNSDPNKKLKEVSPGEWRTLQKLDE